MDLPEPEAIVDSRSLVGYVIFSEAVHKPHRESTNHTQTEKENESLFTCQTEQTKTSAYQEKLPRARPTPFDSHSAFRISSSEKTASVRLSKSAPFLSPLIAACRGESSLRFAISADILLAKSTILQPSPPPPPLLLQRQSELRQCRYLLKHDSRFPLSFKSTSSFTTAYRIHVRTPSSSDNHNEQFNMESHPIPRTVLRHLWPRITFKVAIPHHEVRHSDHLHRRPRRHKQTDYTESYPLPRTRIPTLPSPPIPQ